MFAELPTPRPLATASLIAVLICIGVLSRSATAFNPQPDPPGFGMVGIVEGQTARLNIVNLGIPGPAGLPPDPCRAHLQFFDAEGNVLASRRVNLKPGQAASLDFVASFAPPTNATDAVVPLRAEIRGAVAPVDDTIPPPCRASVEIFDNATGRTSVFLPPDPCRGAACKGNR